MGNLKSIPPDIALADRIQRAQPAMYEYPFAIKLATTALARANGNTSAAWRWLKLIGHV